METELFKEVCEIVETLRCPRCGASLQADVKFCQVCGATISSSINTTTGYVDVRKVVEKEFLIRDAWLEDGRMIFNVEPSMDLKRNFRRTNDCLSEIGYLPFLRRREGKLALIVTQRPRAKPSRWIWNLVLFLATIGTTTLVGYQMSLPLVERGFMDNPWQGALTFSAAVMSILGCHELGHKLMSDRRGVVSSLPYFIPIPFFIGTLGAIIQTKSPAPNRDSLFDLGAAGPILGVIILLPVTALGVTWSYLIPIEKVPPGTIGLPVPVLFDLLVLVMGSSIKEGTTLLFHPVAFAAWVGMLVTMLNLMPAGMLDGGHVARAVLGMKWHRFISFAAAAVTFALGWWYMAVLMLLFAFGQHPGPLDDVSPLTTSRKIAALLLLVVLILCIMPGWMIQF